ncbi:alpha/beta-hydrolase, partial [Aulographum hederae CBS 113979]
VPPVLLPPVVFVGLLLTLWFYKCCMMILFQNKIIYMPSVPPFSRSEKIDDYKGACFGVDWEEVRIKSLDGTRISLCVGRETASEQMGNGQIERDGRRLVVLYLQGNASSLPPRLPGLSRVLREMTSVASKDGHPDPDTTIIALSYRGYWSSRGRASQKGIILDAAAALSWIQSHHPNSKLVIWGQSIGAGVATTAAARYLQQSRSTPEVTRPLPISGLILETPFLSIRSMLATLYPEKWLPYRYLYPFLWNHWDSEKALRAIAEARSGKDIPILLVPAGKDEVVPPEQADILERLVKDLGFKVDRKDAKGALHTEAMARGEGRKAVVGFLRQVA